MDATIRLEPRLTSDQRAELSHLAYFLDQVEHLGRRGVIEPSAQASILGEYVARREAIERRGRAAAALERAKSLATNDSSAALEWAGEAGRLDPSWVDPWIFAIDRLERGHRYEEAIDLADEATPRFLSLAEKAGRLRVARERWRREQSRADSLRRMREAIRDRRYDEVLSLGETVLADSPGCAEAQSLVTSARKAMTRRRSAPTSPPVEVGFLHEGEVGAKPEHSAGSRRSEAKPHAVEPSWAVEFWREHWQKLVLCLAVLLILVSSTLGAHHLLGPLFWSPTGKCLLVLAYTAAFAALGSGLCRWGAVQAGRIMLLTTLAVVPVNFSLAGELRILTDPRVATPWNLGALGLVATVLFVLCRGVTRSLGWSGRGGFAALFFGLSAFNALAARPMPDWGFTAFLGLAAGYLGSVWRVNARLADERDPPRKGAEFAYWTLGLLTYLFFYGSVRFGFYALRLPPPLYALPLMLAAIAAVRTGQALPRVDPDPRRSALLGYFGIVSACAAFALALAGPVAASKVYGANAVATGLLGLLLFATLLRLQRHPAFLYLAFGALLVARLGAEDFIRAGLYARLVRALAATLGLDLPLPWPFLTLHAPGLGIALATLALLFSRVWKDPRLAWHCHAIGLPLAVAACLASGFGPKAAILVMPAYALLFAIGSAAFARPELVYLACAALAGGAYFGSTLMPSMTMPLQALGASLIGLGFWLANRGLAWIRPAEHHRVALRHSALAMAWMAVSLAVGSLATPPGLVTAVPATFLAVALVVTLVGLDDPHPLLAYLSVSALAAAYGLGVLDAPPSWASGFGSRDSFVLLALTIAAPLLAVPGWLVGLVASRREAQSWTPTRLGLYRLPLIHLALVNASIAAALAAGQAIRGLEGEPSASWTAIAASLATASATLLFVTAVEHPASILAYPAILLLAAGFGCGGLGWIERAGFRPIQPALGLAFAGLSVALAAIGIRLPAERAGDRRTTLGTLYRGPLLQVGLLAVALAWGLIAVEWDQYPLVTGTLALTALALYSEAAAYATAPVAYLALASLFGVVLGLFEIATGGRLAPLPVYGIVAAGFALAAMAAWEWVRRIGNPAEASPRRRLFAATLPDAATIAIISAVSLASAQGPIGPPTVAALATASVATLWLTRARRESFVVYSGLGLAVAAMTTLTTWQVGWSDPGVAFGWLSVVGSLCGVALLAASAATRRLGWGDHYAIPALVTSSILAVAAFGSAILGRSLSVAAFPTSLAALAVEVPLDLLLAFAWSSAWPTFGAIAAFVSASYVVLFSLGGPTPDGRKILGLLAAVEALGLSTLGLVALRYLRRDWHVILARPAFLSALVLAALSVVPAHDSPATLGLIALTLVLMVRPFPRAAWLYPSLVAAASGVYLAFLRDRPGLLFGSCLTAAFGLWAVGITLRRWREPLGRWLALLDQDLHAPVFQGAAFAAGLAFCLRVTELANAGGPWSGQFLPALALAGFCLLMLPVYPSLAWVHLASGLAALGVVSELATPLGPSVARWALAAILAADVWLFASWALERCGGGLARRLRVDARPIGGALREWAFTFGLVAAVLLTGLVGLGLREGLLGIGAGASDAPIVDWAAVLMAILLGIAFLDAEGRRSASPWTPAGWLFALIALTWWIGVPASPMLRATGLASADVLPVATAALSLLILALEGRAWWLDKPASGDFDRMAWIASAGLAACGIGFTLGRIAPATVVTLELTALAFGLLAVRRRFSGFGWACGIAAIAGILVGSLAVLDRIGVPLPADRALFTSQAAVLAGAGLIVIAGLLRSAAGRSPSGAEHPAWRLAWDLERVALATAVASAVVVVATSLRPPAPSEIAGLVGVASLLVSGAACVWIAARWLASWPVYLAQAALIGAYVDYRSLHPTPFAADAFVLVLLIYLDLGIAEVLQRFRLHLFARPTLFGALVMPVLLLGYAFARGETDSAALFVAFSTATFYAVAGSRLGWRPLVYAAAVLYNASLWVLWAFVGWRLEDHPSFFLIPVGLTAVLFAETHRRELGRAYVNILRTVGMTIVYASLAVPIWEFRSLGAWLALLLLSLAGIAAGILLRVQVFLWMGLSCFVLDVLYQLGRVGLEHTLAKWGIMLVLGLLMVLFVAVNEKMRLLKALRTYLDRVRSWE